MKNSFRLIGLFCAVTLLAVCSHANTSIPYKIKGEVISTLPEVADQNPTSVETDGDETDTVADETETPIEDQINAPVDLTNAILTISHEITTSDGEVETVILVEQHFDGTFEYEGETIEPTEVTISLKVSEDAEPMELSTVIGTGQVIHFALIDDTGPDHGFTLVGTASYVLNPENKFSISGDLSFLGVDLEETTVHLYWKKIGDDGESKNVSGAVWVNDDSFVIEGDTGVPQVATMYVLGINIPGLFVTFDVILEAQGEYTVKQLGNQTEEFSVSSESGYHALLIDSWQQHEDYLAIREEIAKENERLQELRRSGASDSSDNEMSDSDTAADDTDEGSSESDYVADASENDNDTDSNHEVEQIAVTTPVEPAEGCEDAVVQPVEEATQPTEVVPHQALRSKIAAMEQDLEDRRTQALKEIAENNEDSMARYLAVRLNPWDRNDYSPRIAVLRELENDMHADFVATHVSPLIASMEQSAVKASNDLALLPGQKVPEFTLVNYAGEDVALFDLLAEKDLVLIDFWASWCGPCIADFPELKKLHAAYTDENFEIVGVSIDSTMEDWKGGVDEHELPWVNLGEVKGWDGPVTVSYGVNAIPKGFLVDSQGCIYEKSIRPRALKEFLVDRYGMDESLEEPEVETDDTPDVSS